MDRNRRAKIVATLAASCSSPEAFRELVRAGVDVVRFNFSHGTHQQKGELVRMVRAVSAEVGKPICILQTYRGRSRALHIARRNGQAMACHQLHRRMALQPSGAYLRPL